MPRQAVLRCSPQFVADLGRGRYEVYAHPLPDDAKIVSAWHDRDADLFCLILESASFEDVCQVDEQGGWTPLPTLPPPRVRPVTVNFREFL